MKKLLTIFTILVVGTLTIAQVGQAPVQTRAPYRFSRLFSTGPQPTTVPAAGLVINQNGEVRRIVTKVTVNFNNAGFKVAALTADITLCTIQAKTRVCSVVADTTTAWAGLSGTITIGQGKTVGGVEYILAHDVKTAAVTKGLANGDLGTALATSATTPVLGGDIPSWVATTALQMRLTSGTGNIGTGAATNLTNGVTTFYIILETMP